MAGTGGGDAWRISGEERMKHDSQFFQLKPVNGFITGEQAKGFFMQSGLPTPMLGQIWTLADMNNDGKMDKKEFSIAMHLIKKKLQGFELPKALPQSLKADPSPMSASMAAPMGMSMVTGMPMMSGLAPTNMVASSMTMPIMSNGVNPQMGHMGAQTMGMQVGFDGKPRTGSFGSTQVAQVSQPGGPPAVGFAIPHNSKLRHTQTFNTNDRHKRGHLTGVEARALLVQTGLPQPILAQIWNLADYDKDGKLSCEEFCIALHLADLVKAGVSLPPKLPPELYPAQVRAGSMTGTAQRTGSFTGTPPPHQPAAPQKSDAFGDLLGGMGIPPPVMPQPNVPVENVVEDLQPVTFEDKRKLNFDKGQAELERRRQMLQDQMRAENNARLEKERQEQEKRERIRQEQERKRLMELERQLEKQRSIEREKEQQRQKMLEQKEAARRESDRQRQVEWERQRKEQLLAEKAREYEQLGVAKTKSSNLKCELDSLREKKKDIGQKIGQVRNGVTDFTSSIESMRITRDNKNAEIERLQNEIMTLDQKFAKLKQDQEFLNVKVQTTIQSNPMAETYRTVLHSVEQKKTTIQKLKKELETIERDTESRLLEIDNTNTELKVLKIKLEDIQKELSKADRQRQDMSNKIFAETQIQKKREEEEQQKRKEEAKRITKLAEAASKPEKPAQPAGTNQSSISGAWTADFCNNQTTAQSGDKWSAAFSEASISSAGSNDLWGNAFSSQKPDTAKDTKPRTKAKALYQFDARNHDELTLIPGDIILLLADQTGAEPGWLGGEKDGKTGWFPEAYIEHIDSSQPVTDSFSGAVDTEEEYSTPQSVREVRITSPTPGQGEKAPDGLQAQALYPWKAKKDNHLTFNKGDVIVVKEQQDMWWSGELHGQFGWFPKSYVKLIGGIATNTSQSNSRSETPVVSVTEQSRGTPQQMVAAAEEITTQPPINTASHLNIDSAHSTPTHTIDSARSTPSTLEQQEGECYVAVYSYQSSEPGDLHFNQNDVVMVTKMDGDWWTGSMGERTGIFPHNYVKKMDIPQESLPSVQRLLASRISITELSKEGIYFNKPKAGQTQIDQNAGPTQTQIDQNAGPTQTQIDQMASPENVRPLEQISSPGDDTFIEDPFSTPQFSLDPFSSDPFGNDVFGKPDGPQNTYSDFGDDPFAGFGSSDMQSKSDGNQDGFAQSQLYSSVDQNSVFGTSSEGTKTASQTGTTASVINTSACETDTTSLSTDNTLSGVSNNNPVNANSESFTSGFDQDPFASSSGLSGLDGNIGFGASFDNIDNLSSQNGNVDLFANFEPAPSALDSLDIIVSESTIAHESVDSGVVSSVGQTPPTTLQAENVKTKQKKSIFKFFQRSGEKKTKKKRKESESSNNSDVLESPDTPPVSLGELQNPVAQTLPAVELSPTGESFSPPIQPMSISSGDQILEENIGVKSFFPTIPSAEGSTGTATKGDNQITGNAFEQFDANFDVGSFTDSEVNNNKACQNTTTWPVDNGMDSAQFSFDKGQENSNIGLDCDDKENITSSSTSLMDNINTTPVSQSTDMFNSFSTGQFDTFDPGLYEEVIPKTPPKVVEDTHGDMYEDISEIIAARKELDNKKGVVSVGQMKNVAPPRPPAPSKKKVRFQVAEAPKLDVSEIEKSASDEKAPPLPPQRLKRQRKICQEITLKGDNSPSGNVQELAPLSGSEVSDDVPPALPDRSGTPTKSEKDKKGGDKKTKKADNKKEKKSNTMPDTEDNSLPIPQRRMKKKMKERAKSVENLSSVEDSKTKGTKKSFWPFRKKSDSIGSRDFSKSMENIGDTVLYEEPVSSKSKEQTEIGDFYEPVGVQNSSTTPNMYLDLLADVRKTTDQPVQESSPIEPDGTQTYDDFIGIGGKTSPDLTILTEVGPKIDIPTQSLEPTEPDGTQTYDDFLGIGGTGSSSTLDESKISGQFVTDKENCNVVAPGLDSTDFQIQFEQIDKTRNEDSFGVDFEPSLYDSMPTEYENNSGDAFANKNKNDELSTNPNSVSVPANNAFNNLSRDDNYNEEKVLTAEDDNMYEEVGSPLRKKLGFEDEIPSPDWNIGDKTKSLSIPTPEEILVTENEQPDVEKTFELNEQEDMTNTQFGQSTFFVSDLDQKSQQTAQQKAGAPKKPEIASVIAAYSATGPEQLSLQPGQVIQVRKKSPSGWWEGELQARGQKKKIGWFPANYVKLLGASGGSRSTPDNTLQGQKPEQDQRLTPTPAATVPSISPAVTPQPQPSFIEQVLAVYPYNAQHEDELTFHKDSVINVLNKDDPNWWKGEVNGQEGMFPSNYVGPLTTSPPQDNTWSSDPTVLATTSPEESKRQNHIHELFKTEETYMNDMEIVLEAFYNPMREAGVMTDEELESVFVNWTELILCNTKLSRSLRVRKKMIGKGQVITMIGDILCENLPHLTPYIRFCSCQLRAAALIQHKTETSQEFREVQKKCTQNPQTKSMPLSSFLLKPMQRITKYPLMIQKILQYTPEGHPDHQNLKEALTKAEELCSQVNEGVRERENSDKLEWMQGHINCDGLVEKITFNSVTNCLGPRKILHSGTLYKMKSNKELVGVLCNDFLLLISPLSSSTSKFVFDPKAKSQYKMYKTPIFLNEIMVKRIGGDDDSDSCQFQVSHIDRVYNFKTSSNNERETWFKRLDAASKNYIETERKRREKVHSLEEPNQKVGRMLVIIVEGINLAPSQDEKRSGGVGRLLVLIQEGCDLQPRDANGKSDPYCEVSMGAQEHKTKVIPATLNPKWNQNMQFTIRDVDQDVLCITVFDRDLFSPNDFLGRTEIRVKEILQESNEKRGPISKRLLLHEISSGEVVVKLDLQLYDGFNE